jgi:uncharacterized membrane protein
MSVNTYVVFASQYDLEESAKADFDAVKRLYTDLDIVDSFDAAVITKKPDGKIDIVRQHEEPTRKGAAAGLVTGLAIGALVALFPAVGLAAGLATGGAVGTGVGALAGHVKGGMSRSDLKDLGELLDAGTSGLVVVATSDVEARVEKAMSRARKRARGTLNADAEAIGLVTK